MPRVVAGKCQLATPIEKYTTSPVKSEMFFQTHYVRYFSQSEVEAFVHVLSLHHTVDGRNPAPVDMENLPLFTAVYTSQVVQDFFHQQ